MSHNLLRRTKVLAILALPLASRLDLIVVGFAPMEGSRGDLAVRRSSKRIRARNLLQRSSSLGEESVADHFQSDKKNRQAARNLSSNPLFSIGMLADVQYAPIPDGYSYSGVPRYYRHALDAARHAAQHFEREKVNFVINLGDIVDGKCQEIARNGGEPLPEGVDPGLETVNHVLDALSEYKAGPILHAYGNHCLYNLDRPTLSKMLGITFVQEPCGDLVGYSSYCVKGFRFLTIDTYDVAKMRRCETQSLKHRQAVEILAANNPNYPDLENSPEGLTGVAKRFVAFNGGVGDVQLEWLRNQLELARQAGEKAIVLSHQPLLPGSSSPVCLVWNYKEVLACLREFSDVVVASFAGHAHKGGYKRDKVSGIHFRVLEAVLENPDPHKTYAILDVHNDYVRVRGFGNCKSAVYEFDHIPEVPRDQPVVDAVAS